MTRFNRHHLVSAFTADRSGSFSILFGVSIMAIFLSAGLAVEFARMLNDKSAMSNALDAAVLSTARSVSTGELAMKDADDYLAKVFRANMNRPAAELEGYSIEDIRFDPSTEVVTASAKHNYQTAFRFFGSGNAQTIRALSAAAYGSTRAEVAMTFDITGSMRGDKLSDLKEAAKSGISQLLAGNHGDDPKIRISAIPYADAVNTGALSAYVFGEVEGGTDIAPPFDPDSLNGDPIAASLNGKGGSKGRSKGRMDPAGAVGSAPDACATERKGDLQFSDANPGAGTINRDDRLDHEDAFCPRSAMMPLTTNEAALVSLVGDFQAEGHTAGHIGIQWAWYTLAPQWSGYLPADSTPASYDDEKVRKYAIIMTDGVFNTAYAGVSGTNVRNQPAKSSAYAVKLCERMKAEGIEIFTIGFQLKDRSAIETIKACATPDSDRVRYFYDTSTGTELTDAYGDIAGSIQSLRLVK